MRRNGKTEMQEHQAMKDHLAWCAQHFPWTIPTLRRSVMPTDVGGKPLIPFSWFDRCVDMAKGA